MKKLVGLCTAFLFVACQGPVAQKSTIASVDIPQTPVRNQGAIGLCWSYALVGMLESHLLATTGKQMNFSEEAIGFYRYAEFYNAIYQDLVADSAQGGEHIEALARLLENKPDTLQGATLYENQSAPWAVLNIIQKYGVIPESAYPVKFTDEAATVGKFQTLNRRFIELLKAHQKMDVDSMMDLLVSSGVFPARPPVSVDVEGKKVSGPEFLAETRIDLSQFVPVHSESVADFDDIVELIKNSLAAGYSVPISLSADFAHYNHPARLFDQQLFENTSRDFGHVMLVTDFVNRGGKAGGMTPAELDIEMKKHPRLLDRIVVKNSWGGSQLTTITRDFLMKSTFSKDFGVTLLVQKDVALRVLQPLRKN